MFISMQEQAINLLAFRNILGLKVNCICFLVMVGLGAIILWLHRISRIKSILQTFTIICALRTYNNTDLEQSSHFFLGLFLYFCTTVRITIQLKCFGAGLIFDNETFYKNANNNARNYQKSSNESQTMIKDYIFYVKIIYKKKVCVKQQCCGVQVL